MQDPNPNDSVSCEPNSKIVFNQAFTDEYREERRAIRSGYRKLIDTVVEDKDNICMKDLIGEIKNADELLDKVAFPREGTFDASLMKHCSDVFKQRTSEMTSNFTFSDELFAKRLVAYMKNINPDDVVLPGNDAESEVHATQLTAQDWANLDPLVNKCFKTAPRLHYLYGAFNVEPKVQQVAVVKEKKQRLSLNKEIRDCAVVKPKEVIAGQAEETDEQKTARKIKMLHCLLEEAYNQIEEQPVNYFEFILDPKSFEKSVEHMFYFSFLIKDNQAAMITNENGIPMIMPSKMYAEKGELPPRKQCIISMDHGQWKALVEKFNIEEAFVDLDI